MNPLINVSHVDNDNNSVESADEVPEDVKTFVASHTLFSHLMDFGDQHKNTMNMLNVNEQEQIITE